MRSVEIQIQCGGITEIGWYPCHDEHGIYNFIRGFGFDREEALALVGWTRLAENGEEYGNRFLSAIVEDE